MKQYWIIAASAAIAIAATSCSSTKSMNLDELSGRWEVTDVNGSQVKMTAPDAEKPYLGFDVVNGRLSGNAGCNSLMGSFPTTEPAGKISFSDVATTRMMCPDMEVEQNLVQALGNVAGYKSEGTDKVALVGADGAQLLSLKKIKANISAADLNGTWRIQELAGKQLTPDADTAYTITFDAKESSFSCATGCNVLGGSFITDYTDFKFDLSTSTMMMCPDTSVEDTLKQVLPTVASYGRLAGGGIGFYSDVNDLVLILEK